MQQAAFRRAVSAVSCVLCAESDGVLSAVVCAGEKRVSQGDPAGCQRLSEGAVWKGGTLLKYLH